jgi:hypothetical protein
MMNAIAIWMVLAAGGLGFVWSYVWDEFRSDKMVGYLSVYYQCIATLGTVVFVGAGLTLFAGRTSLWWIVGLAVVGSTVWKAWFDYRWYRATERGLAVALRYESYSMYGCLGLLLSAAILSGWCGALTGLVKWSD